MSCCYLFCFNLSLCPPSLSSSDTDKVLRLDRGLKTSIKPPLSLPASLPSPLGIHFPSFDHGSCSHSQGEAQCHVKLNLHSTKLRSPLIPISHNPKPSCLFSQTILDACPHSQVDLTRFACLLRTTASENHSSLSYIPCLLCHPLDS